MQQRNGPSPRERFIGLLLGTAVGDALGLPAEGLSPRRSVRMWPRPWRHRFMLGHGMLSDDTEHTVFVSQALLIAPDSVDRFARRLAWSLRVWLLALPAGVGLATARAIARLWLGFSPGHSGVWSAGNGPAMRVAPIGARFAHDPERVTSYVTASTLLTHTDPRARTGALAVARLCAWCVAEPLLAQPAPERFLDVLQSCGPDDREWLERVAEIGDAIRRERTVAQFAAEFDGARCSQQGVSGYVYHTVPVVAYAWFRHFGSFEQTLESVLDCGGDSDTTGAIAGALAGVALGESAIPHAWVAPIVDWPRGVSLLRTLGERLANGSTCSEPAERYFWPGAIPRNVFFLTVVLLHGFRRMLPPY